MNLAGQGNAHESLGPRSRLDDRGYVMVVLLIGIAVTAVWMGALLPSWHQQAVRQKEADLIDQAIAVQPRSQEILGRKAILLMTTEGMPASSSMVGLDNPPCFNSC